MFSSLLRILKIFSLVKKYRLHQALKEHLNLKFAYYFINVLFFFIPSVKDVKNLNAQQNFGLRLRLCLEELGPIFIKFGQMVSLRDDFVDKDIVGQLTDLQHNVSPIKFPIIEKALIKALGKSLDEIFIEFDTNCLAAASIAQVYKAKILDENKQEQVVAVKVIRPDVNRKIIGDLKLISMLVNFINYHTDKFKRLKLEDIVTESEYVLKNEINLIKEANNGLRFSHYWNDSEILYIPRIYREYCSESVMVMEFVNHVPIYDIETLKENNVNLHYLAVNGVNIFFTQLLKHNFFHADMHPGNIFVDITDPQKPKYVSIDFGVVGFLDAPDKRYLAENLLAFFRRDYHSVAELHVKSGWARGNIDIEEFANAIYHACDDMFNKPLKDLSTARSLKSLFDVAREFNFEVQPQMLLLQRTLFYIEGIGKKLYNDLNLWDTAKPYLETWIREQYNLKPFKDAFKRAPYMVDTLSYLPDTVYRLFDTLQTIEKKIDRIEKGQKLGNKILYTLITTFSFVIFMIVSIQAFFQGSLIAGYAYLLASLINFIFLVFVLFFS